MRDSRDKTVPAVFLRPLDGYRPLLYNQSNVISGGVISCVTTHET